MSSSIEVALCVMGLLFNCVRLSVGRTMILAEVFVTGVSLAWLVTDTVALCETGGTVSRIGLVWYSSRRRWGPTWSPLSLWMTDSLRCPWCVGQN